VLFVCENNLYAMGTRIDRALASTDIAAKARASGVAAEAIDGMDVVAVEQAARAAAARVRAGSGPELLECRTYRFRAHSMFDAELYRDKSEVEEWKKRDPIETLGGALEQAGLLHAPARAELERQIEQEIAEAVAFAEAGTWEPVETLTRDVYTRQP
jgi:TPP-dependent pyruvate/acetoin dehydrogenase alpha subunit